MKPRHLPLIVSLLVGTASAHGATALPGKLPVFDDNRFPTVQDKSEQFIDYLYRIIERENSRVVDHQSTLAEFEAQIKGGSGLSDNDSKALSRLAALYAVSPEKSPEETLEALRDRVLPVPPSLILAHAIAEENWNALSDSGSLNLFDIPCNPAECDDSKLDKPVKAKYKDINGVVEDYIYNLNTNSLHSEFREKRLSDFNDGKVLNGESYQEFIKPLVSSSEVYLKMSGIFEQFDLIRYDSWR